MYHRFAPTSSGDARRVDADCLEGQLGYILAHHEIWNPDRYLQLLTAGVFEASRPPVVVTVDDGYADFYTVAFPLLRRHGIGATVFVTTGFIAGRCWFWWDRLSYLLRAAPRGERRFTVAGVTAHGDPAAVEARRALWRVFANHLSTLPDDDKETALADLAEALQVALPAQAPPEYAGMTWDQIRELADHGMTLGAHTLSHPVLSRVDNDRAWQEISRSRDELAEQIGRDVVWFCYPQGLPTDFRPETVELVRQAGFRGCFTAFPDPFHDGHPYTLPRYSVSADDVRFRWMMCGAEHMMLRWQALFSRRTGA